MRRARAGVNFPASSTRSFPAGRSGISVPRRKRASSYRFVSSHNPPSFTLPDGFPEQIVLSIVPRRRSLGDLPRNTKQISWRILARRAEGSPAYRFRGMVTDPSAAFALRLIHRRASPPRYSSSSRNLSPRRKILFRTGSPYLSTRRGTRTFRIQFRSNRLSRLVRSTRNAIRFFSRDPTISFFQWSRIGRTTPSGVSRGIPFRPGIPAPSKNRIRIVSTWSSAVCPVAIIPPYSRASPFRNSRRIRRAFSSSPFRGTPGFSL